jgi:16S rRNA (cytosine967-C5)-methyltransferase
MAQAAVQHRLLAAAAEMVKPGGTLIYCVCSLAREEGEDIVDAFLGNHPAFTRIPITTTETPFATPSGDLRTLPNQWPELGGLDGFYAARLRRNA